MITFIILISCMIAVALFFVLPPLLGRYKVSQTQHDELNLAIYQQRLKELEEEDENDLSAEQKNSMRQELKKNLLQDTEEKDNNEDSNAPKQRSLLLAAFVGIAIPLLALAIYSVIGPAELPEILAGEATVPTQAQASQNNKQIPDIATMVAKLEQHMKKDPENAKGWLMLGRSYMYMQRFNDASKAYKKSLLLNKNNPQTLTDYAEALGMAHQGDMEGEPTEYVLKALKLDPKLPKALWLAGTAKMQAHDYQGAIDYWQRLITNYEPGSKGALELQNRINLAAKAMRNSGKQPKLKKTTTKIENKTTITVEVKLDPALASKTNPNETIFVYAKAVGGPPMPLAIVRKQVKNLPLKVILDDSMAMTPRARISSFKRVYVGARISKSGNATPSVGDLQGRSAILTTGGKESAKILIEQELD